MRALRPASGCKGITTLIDYAADAVGFISLAFLLDHLVDPGASQGFALKVELLVGGGDS